MGKARLEAFSDGVIAIIITIMVLELKPPHGEVLAGLPTMAPIFVGYVLSFTYVGIIWINHHHVVHAARRVSASVLWSNLHLLFWVSLMPVTTVWMGENRLVALPTAVYGLVLLAMALAFWVLERSIMATDGDESPLAAALGRADRKGLLAMAIYVLAIGASFFSTALAQIAYGLVALWYVIPSRGIERAVAND